MPFLIHVLSTRLIFLRSLSLLALSLSALAIGFPIQSLAWLLARQGPPSATSFCAARRSWTVTPSNGSGHVQLVTVPTLSPLPSGTDVSLYQSARSGGGAMLALPLST